MPAKKMKKMIFFLFSTTLMFSYAAFKSGSYHTPINDFLGKIIRSNADSTKSEKQLIINEFGDPDHKFVGVDLDTCYTYYHSNSYEEICFNDSGNSKSMGGGVGKPRHKDIQEEYYSYDKRQRLGEGFDYVSAINRALKIKPIEEKAEVIRLYYLSSFQKEIVYEIYLKDKGKIVRFSPVENMIWTDLHDFTISEEGDTVGGRIKRLDEYNPKVSSDADTVVNNDVYNFAVALLRGIGIDTMKCIQYKDIMMLDGIGIKVHLNWSNKINRIEYREARYRDERYNKITDLIKTKMVNLFD